MYKGLMFWTKILATFFLMLLGFVVFRLVDIKTYKVVGGNDVASVLETVEPDGSKKPKKVFSSSCGNLVGECSINKNFKTDKCNKEEANSLAERELGDVMSFKACQDVESDFLTQCPKNCSIDFSSLVSIPGKIDLHKKSEIDSSGQCLFEGMRSVVLKAACVKNSSR